MRVVALISGGKDSCYSMMQCVAAGHQIVALANLQPQDEDELDSFMFQTVGHEGIALYAEATGLPLYRVNTQGRAFAQELQYSPVEGDEVEDLYELLEWVKREVGVEGVACGAVLSDYQRLRAENVCSRLGLVCLAYLWRREQGELLQEMIMAGVKAIVIKVASMGLTPDKHLGKTIKELYPELCELHRKYGINVCGEGGEYETFTLDCPLFQKEIVITSSEVCVHSDDAFAPVAYLKMKELQLQDKPKEAATMTNTQPAQLPWQQVPRLVLPTGQQTTCVRRGQEVWLVGDGEAHLPSASEQTKQLLAVLGGYLSGVGCCWGDVVLVYLYLNDMADYEAINAVYAPCFPSKPPARVCVQVSLPEGVLVRVEGVGMCGGERSSMHVQSVSHWAPANIGPYSQAYTVSNVVFTAGQIGLRPAQMTLAAKTEQPSLSLTHVQCVLTACHSHLGSTLCGMCYFTTEEAGWAARQCWTECLAGSPSCPVAWLRVPALPRGACVEWHFLALPSPHTITYHAESWVQVEVGVVSLQEAWSPQLKVGCWTVTIAPLFNMTTNVLAASNLHTAFNVPAASNLHTASNVTTASNLYTASNVLAASNLPTVSDLPKASAIQAAIKTGLQAVADALSKHQLQLSHMTFLRICTPRYSSGPPLHTADVAGMLRCSKVPLSLLPTEGFYGPNTHMVLQACQLNPIAE